VAFPESISAFLQNVVYVPGSQLGNLGGLQLIYVIVIAVAPGANSSTIGLIQWAWIAAIVTVSLAATFAANHNPRRWQIALWTVVFLLVYHDVWEHHFVILLPILVILYHEKRATLLLILGGLVAIWTPYRLVDPQGLAAYDMSMRWTPLQPAWLNVLYHSSKALPVIWLWGYICRLLFTSRHIR
jgi:hypothetical protein